MRERESSLSWNGRDFYVACGEGPYRTWKDWAEFGFVSGGQGRWYSRTLGLLFPGARVFPYIPKTGYVGVGTVTGTAQPIRGFTVQVDGVELPILEAPGIRAERMDSNADDPERCDYAVPVRWQQLLAREDAATWPGIFGNQNTVCRLRDEETLDRLAQVFDL
jgi:hypothetical protein